MFGIGRRVVWILLPLVAACDADNTPSTNTDEPSSDVPTTSETSRNTAGEAQSETSGKPATTSAEVDAGSTNSDATTHEPGSMVTSTSASAMVDSGPDVEVKTGERAFGARCPRDSRLGALGVNTSSDRTIIAGAISSGVLPSSVPAVAAEQGSCQLLVPRDLFCSSCESTEACAGEDVCVPKPMKVSAGVLRVDGLLTAVEVSPNGITLDYSKTILDPFPAYTMGEEITLHAAGDAVEPFEATVIGVPALTSSLDAVAVKHGEPATLEWDTEDTDAEDTSVFVSFSVNVHGAVTGWIECTAPDTGAFEIPAELVSALIDLGSSGFPRVDIERRSSATVDLDSGCVELYAGAKITLEIELDGLTSCHDDGDCGDGQVCNDELACE